VPALILSCIGIELVLGADHLIAIDHNDARPGLMTDDVDRRSDAVLRGLKRMTDFLRIELGEPDLPVHRVRQWAAAGKIDVDRFGPRNMISTEARLRRSIDKTAA
jgi:hypothetical protein